MSEAKLIKSQHFQSQIFAEGQPQGLRRSKQTDTFASSIFAHMVPERGSRKSTPVSTNYARQRYQLSSTVFAGSIEQASTAIEKSSGRVSPSRLKTAGKKVNPTNDLRYKPRTSATQKSEVFQPGQDTEQWGSQYRPMNSALWMASVAGKKQFWQEPRDTEPAYLKKPSMEGKRLDKDKSAPAKGGRSLADKTLRTGLVTGSSKTELSTPLHTYGSQRFDFSESNLTKSQTTTDLRMGKTGGGWGAGKGGGGRLGNSTPATNDAEEGWPPAEKRSASLRNR